MPTIQADVRASRFVLEASKQGTKKPGKYRIKEAKNETPELWSASTVCCLTRSTAAGVTTLQYAADIPPGTESNAAHATGYKGTFAGKAKQRGGSAANPEETHH